MILALVASLVGPFQLFIQNLHHLQSSLCSTYLSHMALGTPVFDAEEQSWTLQLFSPAEPDLTQGVSTMPITSSCSGSRYGSAHCVARSVSRLMAEEVASAWGFVKYVRSCMEGAYHSMGQENLRRLLMGLLPAHVEAASSSGVVA